MGSPGSVGSPVVARFLDGRVLKGLVQNFLPNRPLFHLYPVGSDASYGAAVRLAELKALLFVKTFEGNKNYVEDADVTHSSTIGRRIVVTFLDGELLTGVTSGYSSSKPGFFVTPTDLASNNIRIFVVASSVKSVAWADSAAVIHAKVAAPAKR